MLATLAQKQGRTLKEQILRAHALCYFNIKFLYVIYVTSLRG